MEEASSFWSRKVAWRCFIAAICAAFMMSFSDLSANKSGAGRGIIVFSNVHVLQNNDWIMQCPFMIVVAALGGVLGAMFNWLRRFLWKVRASRSRKVLRVVEALMTIIYCIIIQFVAITYWGSCQPVPEKWPDEFKVCTSLLACFGCTIDRTAAHHEPHCPPSAAGMQGVVQVHTLAVSGCRGGGARSPVCVCSNFLFGVNR